MTRKGWIKKVTAVGTALALLAAVCAGCGEETQQVWQEDVELLEPTGVAAGYETAARRNLYDAKVYSALVCPYVEEYETEKDLRFSGYDVYPGQAVKKGDSLLHGDVQSLEEQIEAKEKTLAEMAESYQEFVTETNEALAQPRTDEKNNRNILDSLERGKPEQYIIGTDEETGETVETVNPGYTQWQQDYRKFDGLYRSARQKVLELEEALKERTELYELDYGYQQLLLERLKEEMARGTVASGMSGYVAAYPELTQQYWLRSGQTVAAVADLDRLELKCEYVQKGLISRAEDVYAIIDGKRYEVEYQPMEAEEYERLKTLNDKVYSTFYLLDGGEEIEAGSYAVIVVRSQTRENVITVPQDAVKKDDTTSYVYVLEGTESVYTPVEVGMKDGLYAEIISGVNVGDKVLTESAVTAAGSSTARVEKGGVSHEFSGVGYLEYMNEEYVKNPVTYGTCYYLESMVSENQQVSRGDVLARVRVVPDEAELQRNEQKLLREQERLADLKAMGEEENKKAIAAKEEAIRELEELIAQMKADFATTEIRAPKDGIITMVMYRTDSTRGESLVSPGDYLFGLADISSNYLVVQDENGQLTYGNQANIVYSGFAGQKESITGTVVTLNQMAVSKTLAGTDALIMIDPEDIGALLGTFQKMDGWWTRKSFNLTVAIRSMDNVLVVPRRAVKEVSGSTYVKVRLENGEYQYRSFIAGGADTENYWVVEGLTEGMEICLE